MLIFMFRLFLAWALLYFLFRFLVIGIDRRDSRSRPPTGDDPLHSESDTVSGYFRDNPDALRPDIEPDDFDPTDYL